MSIVRFPIPRSGWVAASVAVLCMLPTSVAWGSDLDVQPVRLHLSVDHQSQTLTLVNRGSESLRYQITAQGWSQARDGEMVLGPTQDLVFYPSLLEIAAGATRRVRVAVRNPSRSAERSYRLLLSPLPDGTTASAGTVRVLTRFSLPVFVQPAAPAPQPRTSVRVERGRMLVSVSNAGNSYFVSQNVQVVGRSRSGAVLVNQELPGWYVLAGGERVYEVPLSDATCAELESVTAVVRTERDSAHATQNRAAIHCGS